MSEFQSSNFRKENGGTPNLVGKTELTSPYFFVPPSGDTASRPENCAAGTLRFNTDHGSLEVYRGDAIGWEHIERRDGQYLGGAIGPTYAGSTTGTGTRGITAGGNTPSAKEEIEFITISTFGNSQDFGNLTAASTGNSGSASNTRGIFDGKGNLSNVIEFITISSRGDGTDFGDNSVGSTGYRASCSNQIRTVTFGANSPASGTGDTIDYVNIATTGDSKDFGNLSGTRNSSHAFASTTRGISAGGASSPKIEFITIMTTGNSVDFGSLSVGIVAGHGCSNATRGIMKMRSSYINTLEYVTIATLGNSIDFGDATNNAGGAAAMASPTRAIYAGGYGSPSFRTEIGSNEIATTGDSVTFGDLSYAADHVAGLSNGHGGL